MQNRYSLNVIDIPRPCPADWTAMHGNDQVRFCDHCKLNVYNLSEMTRPQAEKLLLEKEGHLCVRLYRRMDGTVITADCDGAWKLARKRLSRLVALSCAAVLGGIFAPFGLNDRTAMAAGVSDMPFPVKMVGKWIMQLQNPPIAAPANPVAGGIKAPMGEICPTTQPVMGDIAEPPPPLQGKIGPEPLTGVPAPTSRPSTQPTEKK